MRGRSMVGLLDGTKEAIYDEKEFVGGEMGGGKWMRQGDFKAVMVPAPYGTGEWKLYDVVTTSERFASSTRWYAIHSAPSVSIPT